MLVALVEHLRPIAERVGDVAPDREPCCTEVFVAALLQ
jgi:hypothetical protein